MTTRLDAEFRKRIHGAFGDAGSAWLDRLPEILSLACREWSLELGEPFLPHSYNYVTTATISSGESVVLKAGVPGTETTNEVRALEFYQGGGAVKLIKSDVDKGLMLLERLTPGTMLGVAASVDSEVDVFASIVRRLHRAAPSNHPFPTVGDWARGFARIRLRAGSRPGDFPQRELDRAEQTTRELIESSTDAVLLHGDLHHWNMLLAGHDSWLAIDPQGVIGEPEYETTAFLRNPYPQILKMPSAKSIAAKRVDALCERLGFDRRRIMAWGYSQAVLSAVWSFEDMQEDWKDGLRLARLFEGGDSKPNPSTRDENQGD